MMSFKPKKCKVCAFEFTPISSLSRVCSVPCALADIAANKKKAFRAETRNRKVAIKTKSAWEADVQTTFNRYIRFRDFDKPCISCGEFYAEPFNGQLWDCGHFKPIGSHAELRFNELNAHRQHSRCNRGAAKSGRNDKTVSAQYRENLVQRIGEDLVVWLESRHNPLKATIDELRWLKTYYRDRARQAEKWARGL